MAETTDALVAEYKKALNEMREAAVLGLEQEDEMVNVEDLNLEDVTDDLLIEQWLEMGTELGVDTRQGSIYWDACMGSIIRMTTFVEWLSQVKEIISLQTCTGDVLDEKLTERGLTRNPAEATPATYYVIFEGEVPDLDSVMTCEDYTFTLSMIDEDYVIVSEDTGTEMNDLAPGTEVIPEIDVNGLISATLGELAIPAVDIEDDDSARERLINKISGPDENGNKSQIRTWAESVEGVGAARVVSLWNGANTVLIIIVAADGGVPTDAVVAAVQEFIDPGADGMGEGVATIGQICTVIAVEAVTIDISVSVLKEEDGTYSGILSDFEELLEEYFTDMALTNYTDGMAIRYAHVGALLEGIDDVIDYDNLTLNGDSENVTFSLYQIPVLGEVTVNGDI